MYSKAETSKAQSAAFPKQRFRVRDFMRGTDVQVDSPDDCLALDDTLICGNFLHQELRKGLSIHVSDAQEERAFTATSSLQEGLSCIFFLSGEVDLKIGGRPFSFRGDQTHPMTGTAIMSVKDESFQRSSTGPQRLRHLVISATTEWLNVEGLQEVCDENLGARLLKDNLAAHHWGLTPRIIETIAAIFAPSVLVPALRRLYLEGRAVEIITETISATMQIDRQKTTGTILSRQDLGRLGRAIELITARIDDDLTVEEIARDAGTSASVLQRIFRQAENRSVFEYVRHQRLQRAFTLLSLGEVNVTEASSIAGYTEPANFSTAFKRQFGMSPKQMGSASRTQTTVPDCGIDRSGK